MFSLANFSKNIILFLTSPQNPSVMNKQNKNERKGGREKEEARRKKGEGKGRIRKEEKE